MDGQTDGRCDFNMPPEVPSGGIKIKVQLMLYTKF